VKYSERTSKPLVSVVKVSRLSSISIEKGSFCCCWFMMSLLFARGEDYVILPM